jgi:hypothetical protein
MEPNAASIVFDIEDQEVIHDLPTSGWRRTQPRRHHLRVEKDTSATSPLEGGEGHKRDVTT